MKWEMIKNEEWPFNINVTDENGRNVFSADRYAYGTGQKTIEDCESGVGFKHSEKEGVTKELKRQVDNIRIAAAAPEMLEYLITQCAELDQLGGDNMTLENEIEFTYLSEIIEKATGQKIEDILK